MEDTPQKVRRIIRRKKNTEPVIEPLEGGLRVKKITHEYDIQDDINKELYERISIEAFIEKSIATKIKNTVGIHCKKCGSDNVFSESRQTRSADEAMTVFYTCLNCGNKWKVN